MALLLSLNYCLSQTVQKIDNKEVIILSMEEGNKINAQFIKTQKTIDSLKLKSSSMSYLLDSLREQHRVQMSISGARLQTMYNNYNEEMNKHKFARAEADSFKAMYMANKRIYEHSEKRYKFDIRSGIFFNAVLMIFIVMISGAK